MPENFIAKELEKKITSLSIDKEDLLKLSQKLEKRALSAMEIEIKIFEGKLEEKESKEPENIDYKNIFQESGKLFLTIKGNKGESLTGYVDEIFKSENFPEVVTSFYVNSGTLLQARQNYTPSNSFDIFLDFSKPKVFDLSFLPNLSTPNSSIFSVKGYDETWVHGVFNEISNFLNEKGSGLSWVHKHSIYDLLLLILGLPLAFWFCFKFSPLIESRIPPNLTLLKNMVYTYAFFLGLWVLRVLFQYLRWVCPLVEFKAKNSNITKHRWAFSVLAATLLSNFIYDIFISPFIN